MDHAVFAFGLQECLQRSFVLMYIYLYHHYYAFKLGIMTFLVSV